MEEKGNIENSIANCSFVITDENKTAVAIQDNPEGDLFFWQKGRGKMLQELLKKQKSK